MAVRTPRQMLTVARTVWAIALAVSAFVTLLLFHTIRILDTVAPHVSFEALVIIQAIVAIAIATLATVQNMRQSKRHLGSRSDVLRLTGQRSHLKQPIDPLMRDVTRTYLC